ncbi:CBS domain-containing protein [Archangium lipolyticum]|uniref:CBS domain-containing protein n=1 Tax=Archangium lipolyticum TaxID=2970465 RepID=UPI00214A285F|nr:CBS domain-containing protein [Archangium lipolyticum]
MDGRGQDEVEARVVGAVMLFAQDTVVAALRVMQQYGVRQLPVVDEVRGELLGEITDEQLRRMWTVAPLASMAEILSVLQEGSPADSRVQVVELAPLMAFPGTPNRWLH